MGVLFTAFSAQSTYQQAYASTASSFISKYKSDVTKASTKYNLYGSVMMAQAGLESGWGQSQLTTEANNFFGIKGAYNGASVSMPTTEYNSNGQMINTTANFKKYPSAYASFADNGSTLRNGTSWNSKYYSGSWKENAATYEDAANALTGKYATAPNYGQSLITVIQTYNLDQVFGETGSSTSSSATSASSSSASSATSSSATAQAPAAPKLAKVKYYKASGKDLVPLSSKYKKYYVYNHVKGSTTSQKRYTWSQLGVKSRVQVYLDMRGVKSNSSTNWYRLRFYSNSKAKKFWVSAPALSFATTYTGTASGALTPSKSSSGYIYNHIVGSSYLSKPVKKVKTIAAANKGYNVNKTALQKTSKGLVLWYRIADGKTKGWIKGSDVVSYPGSVAVVNHKETKSISKNASSTYLYDHANATGNLQKHYKLNQVDLQIGTKVSIDKIGYKINDHSLWYRISTPNSSSKYWVSGSFLS
ncbi:mannosyl-glycoprotein endo-beta-N-acetylglucosamidase [Lentilactobacillus otakiensis DSM 19908 = JCM 15040]|uniref:Mannosyl-glycoprotein endo-beta-N-acetylglucosamidase n=2 Tax=Lentilactobacillus otakiensis TaxID=481720 RepID=S4NAE2_9LACO|nr:mannosyl-glycoprotein endo-beta-N-acetylglucosamidase [Lentilactobacillus otakiensis DSM 19908 = JCM 15040]GAD15599.1 mannosyl-glycoprotein endo-beta-N-acetylglucosamidase [Lentilactobacillus otakiensis DSM 19908 = JCM 15040]